MHACMHAQGRCVTATGSAAHVLGAGDLEDHALRLQRRIGYCFLCKQLDMAVAGCCAVCFTACMAGGGPNAGSLSAQEDGSAQGALVPFVPVSTVAAAQEGGLI